MSGMRASRRGRERPSPRVIVVGQAPPPVHGSNVMCQVLLDTLARLGVEHRLIDKGLSARLDEVGRFSLVKLLRVPRFYGRVLREVARPGRAVAVSMIAVTPGAYLVDLVALLLLRARGFRIVLYVHGRDYRGRAANSRVRRWWYGAGFALATRTVVLSPSLGADVAPWVPVARRVIIPNCLPVATPYPDRRPDTPLQVLFLGNLIRLKGPLEFLEAAALAGAELPGARFVLAGGHIEPDTSAAVAERLQDPRLGGRVVATGGVAGEDKRALFAESHIFVFPTRYDVLPLAVIEAMEAGLPVIASPAGGVPDMVVDGETGFLVDALDPAAIAARIVELARDPALRERMGRAGRARFETEFSREAYQRHWAEFLAELGVRTPPIW